MVREHKAGMRVGYLLALCFVLLSLLASLWYFYGESSRRSSVQKDELRRSEVESKKRVERESEEALLRKKIEEDAGGERRSSLKKDLDLLAKQLESKPASPGAGGDGAASEAAKVAKDYLNRIEQLLDQCQTKRLKTEDPDSKAYFLTAEDGLQDVVRKWRSGELAVDEVAPEIEFWEAWLSSP